MTRETQSAFARRIGRAKSWITQLKEAGRLVMDNESGLVEVEASIARIAETENPARAGVAERHAEQRQRQEATAGHAATPGNAPPPMEKIGQQYKYWQAVKMKADAEQAQMDRDRKANDLVPRDAANFAMDDLSAGVRGRLENIPDRWAPVLAPLSTLDELRAALIEMVEDELRALAEQQRKRADELATSPAA
jgi:hypothetical protein